VDAVDDDDILQESRRQRAIENEIIICRTHDASHIFRACIFFSLSMVEVYESIVIVKTKKKSIALSSACSYGRVQLETTVKRKINSLQSL
jgi:hypothetical protein